MRRIGKLQPIGAAAAQATAQAETHEKPPAADTTPPPADGGGAVEQGKKTRTKGARKSAK